MGKAPVALIILDGFALREESYGNAVKAAHKPNFDRYWHHFPHAQLQAEGENVGLPAGQMGNSEVGHMNIGAGRIVYQSLSRINRSIDDQSIFSIPELVQAVKRAKENNKALHLLGLLSDGGVHSHMKHLFALIQLAKMYGLEKVYIHAFLDGRDVGQSSALSYIKETQNFLTEIGIGKIASVSGRYYAMDRDKRWERVEKAYQAIVKGQAPSYPSAESGVQASYNREVFDEFVEPFIIETETQPAVTVEDGDSIIFFNFRPDRAIQLSSALTNPAFEGFEIKERLKDLYFVSFTEYSTEVLGDIAYKKEDLVNTIGEVISKTGKSQLRIAETEKYPHVTFFMSGGRHDVFPGEERILIPSPQVATYDLKPEMSAYEVKEALLDKLNEDTVDAVILNFANPDMVGHSGKLEPTIKAIEAVDECLGEIVDLILKKNGVAIITADHGNSDEVITLEGNPMTAHTTNPVPVIVTRNGIELRSDGILSDLAPTMLELLNISQPEEMTSKSLIKHPQA